MRRLLLLLAIVAFAAPSIVLRAQQQPATGILRGIVVWEGTSEPIRDVQITVGQLSGRAQALRTAAQDARQRGADSAANLLDETVLRTFSPDVRGGTPQFTGLTDSNGRFTIEGIPPGEYPLNAQREGYFGTSGQSPVPFARRTVTVASKQTTEVTLTLIPGAAISGRVLDPNGMPVIGVFVEILRRIYSNGLAALQPVARKPTDDRGEYRHVQLSPGEYFVAAGPSEPVVSGGTSALLGEVQIRTFYPDTVDQTTAVPVILRAGDNLPGISIRMRAVTGAKVSGRVVSQLPAPTAVPPSVADFVAMGGNFSALTLLPHDRSVLADPRFAGALRAQMVAPGSGTFEILNVLPGTYDLYATLPDPTGWGPQQPPGRAQQPFAYGRTTIDVRRGDVGGVVVNVHTGLDVKGRVIVKGTTANILEAVTVSLEPVDSSVGINVYKQISRFQPDISPDGSFMIPAVPEANYRLQAEVATVFRAADVGGTSTPPTPATASASPMAPRNTYVEDIRQGGSSIYDDGVYVATSLSGPIDVIINTNGGEIQGTVVRATQQQVPAGTTVVLIPPLNRRQNPALYKTAQTNAQGSFSIRAIPPGQYKLFAWESIPAGAHQNPDFMKKYENRGVSVAVQAGTTLSQAVTLIPAEK